MMIGVYGSDEGVAGTVGEVDELNEVEVGMVGDRLGVDMRGLVVVFERV